MKATFSFSLVYAGQPGEVTQQRSPQHTQHASSAGLVCLTAAVAIDPAVWAVNFALATSQRQLLMAYWVLLLATTVPLIHWVSAANAMPTILVRSAHKSIPVQLARGDSVLSTSLQRCSCEDVRHWDWWTARVIGSPVVVVQSLLCMLTRAGCLCTMPRAGTNHACDPCLRCVVYACLEV